MNPPSSHATLSGLQTDACPPDSLARDLTALADDIERTKKWFNAQMDAQLAGLRELRETIETETPAGSNPAATLSEAPAPVEVPTLNSSPAPFPNTSHPAVILPPSKITALHPDLEQATLRELNEALTSAFAEISARGGMLA
jgi:hypothetical protein